MTRHTHGLRAWLLQRLSAVYLAIYMLYLLAHFLRHSGHSYPEWHAWLTHPAMSLATAGFILAVIVHGWVGMRDIILDYVPGVGLRMTTLGLTGMVLAASGIWAWRTLLLAVA